MFNWGDYLRLADYLLRSADQTGIPEAAYRSALSRAYYSVFCSVREWGSQYGRSPFVPTRSGEDHGLLRQWLRDTGFMMTAQDLESLYSWRRQCDYENRLRQPFALICQQAIVTAKEILVSVGMAV